MIYYSHVNEDNRVERNLLRSANAASVVAVCGSGERVISLLDEESCNEYHIVDVNPEALFLLELKLKALEKLYVQEYLEFIGHLKVTREKRKAWFHRIKDLLSPACRIYWEKNIKKVETGVLYVGHFEKFLNRVRGPVNFFLGNGFQQTMQEGSVQNKFPQGKWNMICKLFSVRWMYKAYGNRDEAFTGHCAETNLIPAALTKTIRDKKAPSSFMMHLIFKGHLRDMEEKFLPPSLNRLVLSRVKQRLNEQSIQIHYQETDMLSCCKKLQSTSQPVFYSVSDLLSFVDHNYMNALLEVISKPGNMIVWRAFLRNRNYQDKLLTRSLASEQEINSYSESESTGMYQVFALRNK